MHRMSGGLEQEATMPCGLPVQKTFKNRRGLHETGGKEGVRTGTSSKRKGTEGFDRVGKCPHRMKRQGARKVKRGHHR